MTAMLAGDTTAFGPALLGLRTELVRSDGAVAPLHVDRWRGAAAGEDHWLLGRCEGPTIDLGCGPGRLLQALAARGVSGLGVDTAPEAIRQCRDRGVDAVLADVFAPLPGEGSWSHVLLADGNLGIGGDPVALLDRAARLLAPSGSVLVELDAVEPGLWCGQARVRSARSVGRPFPWAAAGTAALPRLAAAAGLRERRVYRGRRRFAELVAC
ncbi:methyltransferase domain-containing protein [Pseudonocardia sp. GCM10023141]|uniref:methyltransferase domain-containing protein n=1 Tax=Pseudonocardia sp. GCM10023141 TaxID=3252653 RepID=UPI0036148457